MVWQGIEHTHIYTYYKHIYFTQQWYDKEYSEAELLQGWDNVLDLCKDKARNIYIHI